MAEVYEAFVSLVPSARGFGSATDKAIGPDLEASGTRGGHRWGLAFKAGVATLAVAAGAFIGKSIDQASNVKEAGNVIRVTFGRAAKDVNRFAKAGANTLGQSRLDVLNASATFGTFGKSAGLGGKALAKFSTGFVGLSTDLASFKNTSPEDAVEAIGAALRGESEPIRKYGVLLDDATLRQEALKLGLIKTTKEALTPQQKVLAAQAAIYKQTKDAQGDFARTTDGLANQQRIAAANFDDLSGKVGKVFLPIAVTATTVLNQMFDRFGPAINQAVPKVQAFIASLGKGDFSGFNDFVQGVGPKVQELVTGLGKTDLSGVGADFSQIGQALRDAAPQLKSAAQDLPSLTDALSVGGTVVGFFADHLDDFARALPFLVGGIIAFKVAQAAANLVSLVAVPLRIAEILSIRAHTAALRANTVQTGGATAATSISSVALIRNRIATLAGAVASRIASGASKAWAAGQWLLNAALTANPIGLIIVGLIAVAAALVLAYKKSETFRNIVNKVFSAIRSFVVGAINFVVGFVRDNWKKIPLLLLGPLGIALALIIGHWDKIKAVTSDAWNKVHDVVSEAIGKVIDTVKSIPGKVLDALGSLGTTLTNAGKALVQGLIDGITAKFSALKDKASELAGVVKDFFPGSPVKRGPLTSWNNGGAGKALVDMLAGGLAQTSPVDDAVNNLARRVAVSPSRFNADSLGTPTGSGSGPLVHIDNIYTRDETEAANEIYRKQLKALALASAS